MKNYFLYIAFTLGLFTVTAQDFEKTTAYIAQTEVATKEQEYTNTQVHILAAEADAKKVATLVIPKSDEFHQMHMSVLKDPALQNVREIVKVAFEYHAYSLTTYIYYFLVTDKGDYIALPKVIKIYDDITEPVVDYIFPTQKYGQEETIIKAVFHYTNNFTTEEIEVLQSFVWNDDDFDHKVAANVVQ